jgi:glycosyltransferase involved in cell wall biosynthesis
MKLAIVHDYLNQYGGAERVIEVLHEMYPNAPIYTSVFDYEKMPDSFRNMDIRTSFMQKLPFIKKIPKYYLMLYPIAFKSFNLNSYDIVLSSSSSFAKWIKLNKNLCHICYCYSPTRFIWEYENYIKKEKFNFLYLKLLPFFIKILKKMELKAIENIKYFIAISENIRDKIKKYYNRDSIIIYPPINFNNFKLSNSIGNYFLIVSRLNSYKNIDLPVKVFSNLGLNLKIVGIGPYKKELEKIAGPTIEFLGKVSDAELIKLYSNCRALIFPGEEDFGLAPLEAQASGRPVIAYARGGSLETVIDGKTGIFFNENTEDSFIEAINKFLKFEEKFKKEEARENAKRFDKEVFKNNINNFILLKYGNLEKN